MLSLASDSHYRSAVLADVARKHVSGRALEASVGDGSKAIAMTPSELLAISVSVGVAQWRPGEPCGERLDRGDSAFPEAEGAGRDRISVAL